MPSIFSHPAPTLCLGLAAGRSFVPWRLLVAGLFCSLLPDLDMLGFRLGISYSDILGHRGLSHSLVFALGVGLLAALAAPVLKSGRLAAGVVCGGSVLGHILLDAMTNGGLGVALWWPWSAERVFFTWQPIEVSPFSPKRFFSEWGLRVIKSEGLWIWLPSLTLAAAWRLCRTSRIERR